MGRQLKVELYPDGRTGAPTGLKALTFPDGTQETFQSSAAQRRRRLTRRDHSGVDFEVDSDDRLVRMISGTGVETRYAYQDGRVQRIERITPAGAEQISYQYDKEGNVLSEEGPWGITRARYDAQGRCVERCVQCRAAPKTEGEEQGPRLECPLPPHTYAYDAEGRLISLTTSTSQTLLIQHDAGGHTLSYPNGVVERWETGPCSAEGSSDQATTPPSLQQTLHDGIGQPLAWLQYRYDALERLALRQERWGNHANQVETLHFEYDSEHHLLSVQGSVEGASMDCAPERQPLETFQYDDAGNLVLSSGQQRSYGPMDELLQVGDQPLTYDALGRATSIPTPNGSLHLAYAADHTLISATRAEQTWRFRYDGLGRRIEKTDGVSTWRFGWFGQQLLWEEWQDTPQTPWQHRDYLWHPEGHSPLGFVEAGRTFWFIHDARGAIIRALDDCGKIVWRGRYTSFGELQVANARIRQPWRLAGMYEDSETGLHFTLARSYVPALKTWLTLDPHWMLEGATHYSYARQDPWNRADPTGQLAPLVLAGVGALVGGVVGAGVALATGGNPVAGFVGGAVTGAASVAVGTLAVAGAITAGVAAALGLAAGALGAAAEELTNQLMGKDPFCFKCLLRSVATSVLTDLALLGLGPIPGIRSLAKAAGDTLAGWMSKWPLTKGLLKNSGEAISSGDAPQLSSSAPKTLTPNTPTHKADRWTKYQERGGTWTYERWSKQYDTNMQNYQVGLAKEAEYRTAMNATEGTVKTPFAKRQIDVLDEENLYMGQVKTGYVSLTSNNVTAIQKDAWLVTQGYTVEHILEGGASKPYLEALDRAGITPIIGAKSFK